MKVISFLQKFDLLQNRGPEPTHILLSGIISILESNIIFDHLPRLFQTPPLLNILFYFILVLLLLLKFIDLSLPLFEKFFNLLFTSLSSLLFFFSFVFLFFSKHLQSLLFSFVEFLLQLEQSLLSFVFEIRFCFDLLFYF